MNSCLRNFFVAILSLTCAGSLHGSPTISSFSPAYAAYGDPLYVEIDGSGFWPGTLVVEFNGVQDPTAAAVSASKIQAYVPAGAPAGPGPIMVSVNGLACYSAQDFVVVGSGPYVAGFSPATGSDQTTVVLTGEHFTESNEPAVTSVNFNGQPGTIIFVASDTSLQVQPPVGVTSGPITVVTPQGSFTTQSNFFVPPLITGFSPAAGRAGTNVVVSGSNLLGATAVFVNGLAVAFNATNDTTLVLTIPANATTGPISLIAPAGSFQTASNLFIQPTIFGFAPAFGPASTPVTLTGANFNVGTPVVTIGGANAVVQSVSFSQATVLVPAGATTGPITLKTADGTATSSTKFYLPPAITGVSPKSSPPTSWIRISGVNFTDASSVTFNGQNAPVFVVTNNTTLGVEVPIGVTSGPIGLTTPGGSIVTGSNLWFYTAPAVTGFSPTHGLPGTNVVVSGANFVGITSVLFNGTPAAAFSIPSTTTLYATVPAGAATGPISVVGPGGTATSSSPFAIDSSDLALSVVVTPSPALVGAEVVYTITVVNNGPFTAPAVMVGDIPPSLASLVSVSTSLGFATTNMGYYLIFSLGDLPVNATATLTLVDLAPPQPATITNYANVTAYDGDPLPANNSETNITEIVSAPKLAIQHLAGSLIEISWPAVVTNYHLQFNAALADSQTWSNVTTVPVLTNRTSSPLSVVIETSSKPARFYRLTQ